MNDANHAAAANGSLTKTPFAHLVLYLYQRRASGTLIVQTNAGRSRVETRVLFHRGRAVAAHLSEPASALDEGLLPLCAAVDGEFQFHESDLVGSGAAIVTGMFDPFAFVAESARRHVRNDIVQEVLGQFATTPLSLQPSMDLSRLSLIASEQKFVEPLQTAPLTIASLCAASDLAADAAERLLYVLLITKTLVPHVDESATDSPRAGPNSTSQTVPRANRSPSGTPRGSPPPSSPASDRTRSSGAAWRAIASRAAEMATNRQSQITRPLTPPPTTTNRPEAANPGARGSDPAGTPPRRAEPASPAASQPVARSPSRPINPAARPASRPLTPAPRFTHTPPGSQPAVRPGSRPLTPAPFGSVTPTPMPRTTPSAPMGRVTPRPSLPPIETLDAPNKFRRVELLCQRHAYDEALPIIRALVEDDRKSAKYLGMLSHVLLGLSSDGTIAKEIVETVNQALRLDQDQPHALYTKARCYKRMGKEREALHYFRRIIAIDPAHLEATREVRLLVLRLSEKKKR